MNGIIYIVFSREYERFAIECLKISRKNTKHPFLILHNLKPPSTKWNQISGVSFKYFNLDDNQNRKIKTAAVYHSPFKNMLLLDCDTIIQKEIDFSILKDHDIVLNRFLYWRKGVKILRIYKRAFKMFNVSLPVSIYNGAFLMCRTSGKMKDFFNLWHKYWIVFGRKREMPCLACAVHNSNLRVKRLPKGYFEVSKLNDNAVIQHDVDYFSKKFNIKPLNKTCTYTVRSDWNWVDE
jgi:hypothetical protein